MSPPRILIVPHIVALILLSTISIPAVCAGVTGDVENWEEDGWLKTKIATDRLAAGDEFGCYGFPGYSWQANAGDVASACRDYLTERIAASRWSDNPVSIYTPDDLNYADHEAISNLGFSVHGDNTGLPGTAWHSANDTPSFAEDWYNLGRRGGSIESVIADQNMVESEAQQGGLLNFYWIGRVNDASVRHDGDLVDWLEGSDGWSTTWGEAWSYWASQRCYELDYEASIESGEHGITFQFMRPESCIAQDSRVWPVPLTWVFDLNDSIVERVANGTVELSTFDGTEKILNSGWWQDGNLLYLTVRPNIQVEIITTEAVSDFDIVGVSENFNNRSFAFTIAGHSTEDLFQWSKRYDDSNLRFTWLVIPRTGDSPLAWLPVVGVIVLIASVAGTYYLTKKDQHGHKKMATELGIIGDESE
ncbi:MAG: hypothetical protein QF817_02975 [Candidatus Poseidoniaceae archaeon]|jgi:hypothetical protein|nr:hypothetical protein [Candidatus Poseidoniaceae archaeon]